MRRTNLIDSPGLFERNHQLVLGLISGQVRTPEQIANTVVKATPAGIPVRIGDVATVARAVKPVYTIVTANGKPSVLLNINRQPDSNTVQVADEVHAEMERIQKSLASRNSDSAVLRSVDHRRRFHQERARRDSAGPDSGLDHSGGVPAGLGNVDRRRPGDSGHDPDDVRRAQASASELQPDDLGGLAAAVGLVIDDAIVVVENIVLHRDAGQDRLQAIHSALAGDHCSSDRFHDYARGGVSAVDFHHRSDRNIFSRTGRDHGGFAVHIAGAGADLDPESEPVLHQAQGSVGARRSASAEVEPEEESITRLLAVEEASMGGFFRKVVNFHERWLRRAAGEAPVARGRGGGAGGCVVSSATIFGIGLAAGDGRRRFRSGLHHARWQFAGGDQPRHHARREDSAGYIRRLKAHRGAPGCNSAWRR